jgi:hypothetical protein
MRGCALACVGLEKDESRGAFAVIFEIQAIRFRSGDQHPEVIDRLTCDVPDLEAAKRKAKDLVMTVSWRSQSEGFRILSHDGFVLDTWRIGEDNTD